MTDRVVAITGSLEQVLRATALVVTRVTEEPSYPSSIPRPYTYGASAGAAPPPYAAAAAAMGLFAPRAGGRLPSAAAAPSGGGATTSVVVAVPDEHVGALIGRNGATITEMQAVSGVSIKVSSREDVVAHTGHRKVRGALAAVLAAAHVVHVECLADTASCALSGHAHRHARCGAGRAIPCVPKGVAVRAGPGGAPRGAGVSGARMAFGRACYTRGVHARESTQ